MKKLFAALALAAHRDEFGKTFELLVHECNSLNASRCTTQ